VAANRLLAAAGLSPQRDLTAANWHRRVDRGAARGRIDAFFWSDGLPPAAGRALRDRPIGCST